jgi:hypothetical protein
MHDVTLNPTIAATGEKILVILRRHFEEEPRRHFAGVVEVCVGALIRATGFLFIHDDVTGEYTRKPEKRTQLFRIDNEVKITILPPECDLGALHYAHVDDEGTFFTDGRTFSMDVSEFTARR